MAFLFNNSNDHPLQAEPISIGCEAWIDVNRFCAAEKSGTIRASGDHSHSATSQSTLTRSLSGLQRKFRKSLGEDVG